MHIILDSFEFETNIGRSVVYRDTEFVREFIEKFFQKVILGRFVKTIAGLCAQPAFRAREYEESMRLLLADVCIKADENGFNIPREVLKAPFLQSYVSFKPYCLAELDEARSPIYFTREKPTILNMREPGDSRSDIICLCISDLPWEFRAFLENRYAGRLREKEDMAVVVDQDKPELVELTLRIKEKLGRLRVWQNPFYDFFETGNDPMRLDKDIRLGRLVRFDGREETQLPTLYSKADDCIYLNHSHPHIKNLIELLLQEDGTYCSLAAHLLMREVFFDSALRLSISQRESLLTRDLTYRFHAAGHSDEEAKPENFDSLVEQLMSGLFDKGILEI